MYCMCVHICSPHLFVSDSRQHVWNPPQHLMNPFKPPVSVSVSVSVTLPASASVTTMMMMMMMTLVQLTDFA